jgi:hypothetical protein
MAATKAMISTMNRESASMGPRIATVAASMNVSVIAKRWTHSICERTRMALTSTQVPAGMNKSKKMSITL